MKPELKPAIDVLFANKNAVASFHDVLVEIEAREYSETECREAFDKLPDNIKFVALQWGLSDTEFRDAAYVYLKESK